MDINGKLSNPETINISELQGTTLGPILFSCYINNIFYTTELDTYLFADDTTCLAQHKNLNDLITFITTELQKLPENYVMLMTSIYLTLELNMLRKCRISLFLGSGMN